MLQLCEGGFLCIFPVYLPYNFHFPFSLFSITPKTHTKTSHTTKSTAHMLNKKAKLTEGKTREKTAFSKNKLEKKTA